MILIEVDGVMLSSMMLLLLVLMALVLSILLLLMLLLMLLVIPVIELVSLSILLLMLLLLVKVALLELATLSMLESCSIELLLDMNSYMGDDKLGVTLITAEDVVSILVDIDDGGGEDGDDDSNDDSWLVKVIASAVDKTVLSVLDNATVVSSVLVKSR